MQQQSSAGFGIEEARRVLGEVFAPWVLDLKLSIEALDYEHALIAERRDLGTRDG